MTSTRRDTQGRSLNASALRKLFVSLPQLISRVFVRIKKNMGQSLQNPTSANNQQEIYNETGNLFSIVIGPRRFQ